MDLNGWEIFGGSRRDFLKAAAIGTVGSAFGPAAGRSATKTLSLMHESSFIKAYDEHFQKKLAPAYEKLTGVKVNYELTSVGGLQTRVATVAETGSGPDLTLNALGWVFLYGDRYLDVSDIAEEAGEKNGGWYESVKDVVIVDGKWKAVPFGNIGQLMCWRTDWFKEAGYDKFPDTWDELLEAGTKLKANGHPMGCELGHGFGDNHGWLYPLLWSYGAREVEPDGRTVAIDADETARAIDMARKLFRQTMAEEVLGWTDPNNNKAWLSEQISCTNNAASILWVAKQDFPDIAKVTDHALNPAGPKGRFHILNPWTHAIFVHTPEKEAARGFLRWLMQPEQLRSWYVAAGTYYAPFLHAYDNDPMWKSDPRWLPYRDSIASSHLPGWPAPISRNSAESVSKYVVVDMFAKACAGASTKDVITAAAAQLKQIYRTA